MSARFVPSQDEIADAIDALNGALIARYAVAVHQHVAELDQDTPKLVEAASNADRDLAIHRQVIKTTRAVDASMHQRERELMAQAFNATRDLEMRRAAVKAGDRNLQLLKKVLDQVRPI